MITITQPQIDAICWAAERHVRSLRRSGSDHELEIKEIQGWLEALKNEKCQLSFIRLAHLLKMYPTKQLCINFTSDSDHTQLETIIQLLAQQTRTINRIDLKVHINARSIRDFRRLDILLNWLRVFERIDHFKLHYSRASMVVLELIASLPIHSLCVCTDFVPYSFISFICLSKTIEHLKIVTSCNDFPLKALKENRTLKVIFVI